MQKIKPIFTLRPQSQIQYDTTETYKYLLTLTSSDLDLAVLISLILVALALLANNLAAKMQQSTISVSKGCFIFKNGPKLAGNKPTKNGRRSTARKNQTTPLDSLLTDGFQSQRWYQAYTRTWSHIQSEHERLQTTGNANTLAYLRQFVLQSNIRSQQAANTTDADEEDPNMPTAALLTGINQPDHVHLFRAFADIVRGEMRSHVCILQSMDCPNMKAAIEAMVSGLMENVQRERVDDKDVMDGDEDEDCDDDETSEVKRLRRSQYTMAVLKAWYAQRYPAGGRRPILAVIVPDFENFQRDVLQQFILLLNHNCKRLPLVLVLGVATDLATLHRTLSFADTSRMSLQVSQSQPSTLVLSKILDEIVLTPNSAITLSAKVFTLLTDIFLYYDLSINSFMQGFKYCVMEHYCQGNLYAMCTTSSAGVKHTIQQMTSQDLDEVRRLPSFRKYVESLVDCRHVIAVLTDEEQLRGQLHGLVEDCRVWLQLWYGALRVLLTLVQELPRTQLGKQLRDLYSNCAATQITSTKEFESSWELLAFLSRDELIAVLNRTSEALRAYADRYASKKNDTAGRRSAHTISTICGQLQQHIERIRGAGHKSVADNADNIAASQSNHSKVLSRHEMQARILEMSKQPKTISEFTVAVTEALDYLRNNVLAVHLRPFGQGPPLLELFVFGDVTAVRAHIMGAPRAALHTALHNPQSYLLCDCCALDNATQMTTTLPDLSIVYKLHLESGQMINLFDWMQAFRAVVEPDAEDLDEPISPQLQARFTRTVAEMQFLGFIKSSKRKTDHVARLTW